MKKKISLLLCVLVMVFSFVGCSGEKVSGDKKDSLEASAELIISSFSQMPEEDLNSFKTISDFQLDYVMMANSIPASGENFIGMINSWQAAQTECGKYVSHGDYEIEATNAGFTVSTNAVYEDRNATISFSFDESMNIEAMDVSAKYDMNEILTKAGLNTVLGMGTVFAVLIFLAFLIDLMKYIPNLMELFNNQSEHKEKKAVEVAKAVVKPVETAVATTNEIDDLELVAVITAAIAAQEGTATDGFVVRSIRRRPSNKWS